MQDSDEGRGFIPGPHRIRGSHDPVDLLVVDEEPVRIPSVEVAEAELAEVQHWSGGS